MAEKDKPGKDGWKRAIRAIIIVSVIGISIMLWMNLFYPLVEDTMPVWELFIIFYVLISLFWTFMFSAIWGVHKHTIIASTMTWFLVAMFDIYWSSAMDMGGNLSAGEFKGSIGYFFGYYIINAGITGIWAVILLYVIIPPLILLIFLFIFKPWKFLKAMKTGAA